MHKKITLTQFFDSLAILDKLDDTPLMQAKTGTAAKKIEKATNQILKAMGSKYEVQSMTIGSSASIRSAVINELKKAAKNL